MGLLSQNNKKNYRVFNGKTFERFDSFYGEKWARLKGEEIIILGDAEQYELTEHENDTGETVFTLWIH